MTELIVLLSNSLVSAVLLGYLVVFWLALVVWTGFDIASRTKNFFVRLVCIVLVGIGSIFGFLLYLVIRPQSTLEDNENKKIEEKILENQSKVFPCPKCNEYLRDDFLFCTNCGINVKRECPSCQRILFLSWSQCPFCGMFVGQAILPRAREATNGSSKQQKISVFSLVKNFLSAPKEPTEIKRGRGRPRKYPLPTLPIVKRPRGRPRKYVA